MMLEMVYAASLNVEQSNTVDLSLYNGEVPLGNHDISTESGRAMVKLQLNNGVNAWLDQGMSDLPMVAFATPKKGSTARRAKDTEQSLSIYSRGKLGKETSISISGKNRFWGFFLFPMQVGRSVHKYPFNLVFGLLYWRGKSRARSLLVGSVQCTTKSCLC